MLIKMFLNYSMLTLAEKGVELVSFNQAIERANVVVVLVDHKEFKAADKTSLARKVVIDTRGIM